MIPEARRPTHDHAVFDVQAEIQTAGDDKVCAICQELAENGPYDLDEAEEMIPAHGNVVVHLSHTKKTSDIFLRQSARSNASSGNWNNAPRR